ncbi:MAG: tRNA (N(6)-L-threonylcarbamoyladenosine(37)-C(2))-methylthiotransferase MtaB [Rhodovibrionaceae bacterium]
MNAPLAKAPLEETEVVTFGCRLNAYESEVMRDHARAAGLKNAVILNSCAVTAEAERQLRQTIRRTRRERPEAQIVVTGCAAQISPETYAAMPEVDRVVGNREKLEPAAWAAGPQPRVAAGDIMSVTETAGHLIQGFAEKTRAFVQVQQGCDHRCTFCIIPYGRGNSRSLPLGAVVDQTRALVENGVKEVVLTGVDITSYGGDLPGRPQLGQLVRRLLACVPELPRLRLSSIDAVEIDPELLRLIAEEPRLMPHLHLSLQAGDDMILKRMKRRHLRADAVALCDEVRRLRPDVVFGADLIAGFPTESDAMFENSLALIADCGLTYLHVFPYSEREGTPAARMPQVDKAVRKDRAARLRKAGAAAERAFLESRIGTAAEVLIEKDGFGRCAHYAPVRVAGAPGEILRTRIAGVEDGTLLGSPLGVPA